MESFSLDEMCDKLNEIFSIDFDNEQWQISTYKRMYWSASILAYLTKFPAETKNNIDKNAEYTLTDCIDLITDEIAERGELDEYDEIDLYWFCRYEILSCFPGIYGDESEEWTEEVIETFQDMDNRYPINLLWYVLDMILYSNNYVNSEIAEILLTNYLKNCHIRFGSNEQIFGLICGVAAARCAIKLRPEFAIAIYDEYSPFIENIKDMVDYSDVLSMIAPIFIKTDIEKAYDMLQEALRIRLSLFGEHHIIVGITYCQISAVYYFKKDYFNCIDAAIKAYEAFPEENQNLQLGNCLVYMLHSYFEIGKSEECPKWFDIINNIYYKNQNQPDSVDLFLEISVAFGNYYISVNQPVIAEKYYRDGISMGEKYDSANKSLESLKLNLSVLFGSFIGDTQIASDMISEYVSNNTFEPSGNMTLSLMYRNSAILSESSIEIEQKAKQSLDEILVNPIYSSYKQKIFYALALLTNQKHHSHYETIMRLINESENEIILSNAEKSETMIELLACKARFAFLLNDYEKAEFFAQEVFNLSKNSASYHDFCLFCGTLAHAMGKNERALMYYNEALTKVLSRLNTAKKYLNESRVRDYLNVIRIVTNYYFSLVTTNKTSAGHKEQYNILLKTKSLPSLIEQVKKDVSVRNQKQIYLLEQINKYKGHSDAEALQHIEELELEYAAADTTVLNFPETRFEDIREKLPPRSAIIEFFEYSRIVSDTFNVKYEERVKYIWYAVFVTVKNANGDIKFTRVRNVDSLYISKVSKELRYAIEQNDQEKTANLRKRIYNVIFRDIRQYLVDCERLYIAPDSDLTVIPFEILGKKEYLMDKFKIIYLETGRDINANSGFVDVNGVSVVIGNPQYRIEPQKINKKTVRDLYKFRGSGLDEDNLQLPFSKLEAQVVAEKLRTSPLLEKQATKYAVLNSENPKILHIATHGDVNDLDVEDDKKLLNPMMQSYLKMAGATSETNKPPPNLPFGNGILTANEIAQKNLSGTDLVVLSACVTGLGKKVYSEVVGMRAAFKVAGAKYTIVSLWHVDDFATAVFMDIFYTYLINYEVHDALRIAKLTMRILTIGMLRNKGWFAEDIIKNMGESAVIVEEYAKMNDEYKPFSHERSWAGFICQQN